MLERVGAKALDECARLVDVAGAIETDAVEELLALVGLDDVRLTSAAVVAEPDGDGAVVISLGLPHDSRTRLLDFSGGFLGFVVEVEDLLWGVVPQT